MKIEEALHLRLFLLVCLVCLIVTLFASRVLRRIDVDYISIFIYLMADVETRPCFL